MPLLVLSPSFLTKIRPSAFDLPYIADFACRDCKLIVEVDGATHGTGEEVEYDERRSTYLREQGYHILRFWNDDMYAGLPDVCDAILLALAERK